MNSTMSLYSGKSRSVPEIAHVDAIAAHALDLVLGALLLIESIFLLLTINAASNVRAAVRRLVSHQACVLILMSIILIRSGFLSFAELNVKTMKAGRTEYKVYNVSSACTEGLLRWGTVLMAVFALALQDSEAGLYQLIKRGDMQFMLIFSMWIIVGIETTVIFSINNELSRLFTTNQSLKVSGGFDVASLVLLLAFLMAYFVKAKRRVLVVDTEQDPENPSSAETMRLAGTLIIVSGLSVVLDSPFTFLNLYLGINEDENARQDLHFLELAFFLLWHTNNILLLVIFFVRHEDLRREFKVIIFRKCFKYEDDKFSHQMNSHFDRMSLCHEMTRDPKIAAQVLKNPVKKRSLAGAPALMKELLHSADSSRETKTPRAIPAEPPMDSSGELHKRSTTETCKMSIIKESRKESGEMPHKVSITRPQKVSITEPPESIDV